MKRAVRLFILTTVSSLLLTGCNLPMGWYEKIVGWRPMWLEHATPDQIAKWFGFIIVLLALILLIMSFGQASQIIRGGSFSKAIALPLSIGFTLMFLLLMPQTISQFAEQVIPDDFILDTVLRALRIELEASFEGLVHAAWASGVSIAVPQYFTKGVFVLMMLAFPINALGIFSKSLRGVIFTVAATLGPFFFLVSWISWVLYIAETYPSWELAMVKAGVNVMYTGVTIFLFGLCFYVIPFSAFILWKDNPDKLEVAKEEEARQKHPRDWSTAAVAAGTILGTVAGIDSRRERTTVNNTMYGYPPYYGPDHQLPGEVVNAEIHEVPRLNAGVPQLAAGDTGDNDGDEPEITSPGPTLGTNFPEDQGTGPNPPPTNSTPAWKTRRREKPEDPVMGDPQSLSTQVEPPTIVIDTAKFRQNPPMEKPGKAKRLGQASGLVAKAATFLGHPEVAAVARGVGVAAHTTDQVIKNRKAKAKAAADDPVL